MTVSPDLSGRWVGFYTQRGHEWPMSAEWSQDGDRLVGTMNDAETAFEASVAEVALDAGLAPGADESIVAQVRAMAPTVEVLPVRAELIIPAESEVKGEVAGGAVRFRKRYRGPFFAGYRLGDVLRVGITGQDQEVDFGGRLSPDGDRIEGRWRLPAAARNPLLRGEGEFVLRRLPGGQSEN
jgi:hypothetical protein